MSRGLTFVSSPQKGDGDACPPEKHLVWVASGLCQAEVERQVLDHVAVCDACRKRLDHFCDLEMQRMERDEEGLIEADAGDAAMIPFPVPPSYAVARREAAHSVIVPLGSPVRFELGIEAGLAAHSSEVVRRPMDFPAMVTLWEALTDAAADVNERQEFALGLTAVDGGWIQACRALARRECEEVPSDEEVEALLSDHHDWLPRQIADGQVVTWGGEPRKAALLMLRCAKVLAAGQIHLDEAEGLEKAVGLVVRDLPQANRRQVADMLWMLSGEGPAEEGKRFRRERRSPRVELPVVLVRIDREGNRRGVVALLQLDLIEEGTGETFAAARTALVPTDTGFTLSLAKSLSYLRHSGLWDRRFDVRWAVKLQQPLTLLWGASLGGAFVAGVGELAGRLLPFGARPALAESILNSTGRGMVCISGAIKSDEGEMDRVEGVREKVLAALEDATIAILVFPAAAQAQLAEYFGARESVQRPGIFCIPAQGFRPVNGLTVLCVETFAEALDLVPLERDMPTELNWGSKLDWVNRLVARPWLRGRVDRFIRGSHDSGMFLIEGEAGTGKSGFISRCIGEELRRGARPVVHFLTREFPHWDDPAEMYGSLCAQIRRKHAAVLKPGPGEELARSDGSAPGAARRLVADLVKLSKNGVRECLWIDALDESYGEDARFKSDGGALHELVEALEEGKLPPGIRLVVTSRPGVRFDHLRRLRGACIKRDRYVNLDDSAWKVNIEEDLRHYFEVEMPAMDWRALDRVIKVVKDDRPFLHAVLWARSARLHGSDGNDLTLNELLDRDLAEVAEEWARSSRKLKLEQAAMEVLDALGLLACAREPLTPAVLQALFDKRRATQIERIAGHAARCALLADFADGEALDRRLGFFHESLAEFIVREDPRTKAGSFLEATRSALARVKGEGEVATAWHRELARGCERWKKFGPSSPGRVYALRFLLSHLRHARMWKELEEAFTDIDLLGAKLNGDTGGIFDFVRLLEKALGGYPCFPSNYFARPLLNAILVVLKAHEDAISRSAAASGGGSGWLALQLLANEVTNPFHDGGKDGTERFLKWREAVLRALEAGENSGFTWLKLKNLSLTQGAHAEKLRGHVNTVCAVAFSRRFQPPGKNMTTCLLASAGADREIHVWKVDAGHRHLTSIALRPDAEAPKPPRRGRTISPYPLPGVAYLHISEEVVWLVSASAEGVWAFPMDKDPSTGPEEVAFLGTNRLPQSLAAPSEGYLPYVAVGCQDGRALIWNVLRRQVVAELGRSFARPGKQTGADPYCCVAMSPRGDRVAVGCPEDRFVRVWELAGDPDTPDENGLVAWKLICELPPTADRRVDSLAVSPDGKLLAVGGGFLRGHVELWDLEKQTCMVFPAHKDAVWALAFARDPDDPNGLLLISGSYDRTVAVWELKAIQALALHSGVSARHVQGCAHRCHAVLDLRNLPKPLAHRGLPDAVHAIAVSPDGIYLAVGGADCVVSLWDLAELIEPRGETLVLQEPVAAMLHAADIHPSGNRFATVSAFGEVAVRSGSEEGREVSFNPSGDKAMRTVKFSPDGQLVVYGGDLGAGVYDLNSGVRFGNLAPGRAIYAAAFSNRAQNPRLALGDQKGAIILLESISQETGSPFTVHQGCIRGLAFSPDDRWLASVGDDRRIILTELAGERRCREIGGAEGHLGRVKSVAFSPCGQIFATGGFETVKLWKKHADNGGWSLHATLRGHRDEIWSLAFSPNGRLLVSGSHDCTARIWDVEKCVQICSFPCWNNVLAVWLNRGETELRVLEAGQTGSMPAFHVTEIRGPARK